MKQTDNLEGIKSKASVNLLGGLLSSNLKSYKLGDVAEIIISSVDKKTKVGEQKVRLCNFVDVYHNWAITQSMHESFMIASAKEKDIERLSLKQGYVALTKDSETRDDIGISTYIADNFDSVILGYHCALVKPNEDILLGKYLNAFLHSNYIKKYFELNATGSGMRYTLSAQTLYDIPILLPSLEEQEYIGNVFSTIDRKIALNRSINHNLEAMAKQLYDYWFLQFDFPDENGKPYKSSGGKMVWNEKLKMEIPEGWCVDAIGNILDKYPTTKRYETKEYLSIGEYPIVDQGDAYIVGFTNENDNLLSRYPAVLFGDHSTKVKLLDFPFARGADGTQILYSKTPLVSQYYLYLNIASLRIPNPGYSRHFKYLKELPIVIPSKSVIDTFTAKVKPLYIEKKENIFANIALTTLHDSLLPLLMNGQVSLNYDLSSCILSIFSYNRIEQSRMHLMNKKMIDNIVAAMSEVLEVAQQMRLREVLQESFAQVVMSPAESEKCQRQQANEELLQAFIAAKKIEGCSEKTLHYYTSTIEALLNMVQKRIDEYDTNDIRTYLSHYQEERGSSRVTIDNLRRIFSSFFAWLEDEDYIAKSPVRRIHKVRTESLVKEVLSDEHMEVLRDSCTELRDLAIIDLLASTGVRVGELVQMNCADIDFHERQCVVLGKGNKEREVYFNARTKIHLQRYLESRRDQNPALFVALSSPHNRLTIGGIEARLRQLGKRVGLNKVHPHKFRRTLATMAIDKGMPIEQVQRLLGHVKIDTTLHYAMVNQTNVKMAHRKYIS